MEEERSAKMRDGRRQNGGGNMMTANDRSRIESAASVIAITPGAVSVADNNKDQDTPSQKIKQQRKADEQKLRLAPAVYVNHDVPEENSEFPSKAKSTSTTVPSYSTTRASFDRTS